MLVNVFNFEQLAIVSATFGPVAEQHVNTSRRKLEEILVKVAMRILMQMKMKMKMMKLFSGENKKEVGGDPRQGGDENIDEDEDEDEDDESF